MAEWAAGERLTASKLSTTTLQAAADAILAVTTTVTDIPGATISFTATRDDVLVRVVGVFDCETLGTTAAGIIVARANMDGAEPVGRATFQGQGGEVRGTVTQTWLFTVDQGPHTVKLRAARSGGVDGDTRINPTHTTITAIIEDNV